MQMAWCQAAALAMRFPICSANGTPLGRPSGTLQAEPPRLGHGRKMLGSLVAWRGCSAAPFGTGNRRSSFGWPLHFALARRHGVTACEACLGGCTAPASARSLRSGGRLRWPRVPVPCAPAGPSMGISEAANPAPDSSLAACVRRSCEPPGRVLASVSREPAPARTIRRGTTVSGRCSPMPHPRLPSQWVPAMLSAESASVR